MKVKIWRKVYGDYSISELLCEESYVDWVLQGKDPRNEWNDRVKGKPQLAERFKSAEKIIKRLSNSVSEPISENRIESIKAKIDADISRLDLKESFGMYEHKPTRKNALKIIFGIAASLTLVLTSAYFLFVNKSPAVSDDHVSYFETKNTENGQKLTVYLSDGSMVRLNSSSQIAYGKGFTDSSRVIHLIGEAFFEVAKDASRPFQVISGNSLTQALGTSFNIKNEKDEVSIALLTGKVSVSQLSGADEKVLFPGQKMVASINALSDITNYEYEDEFAWKDDVLVFSNATSKKVFDELEKWYGATITVPNDIDHMAWNYTGKFDNKSLRSVLTSIGFTENFEFEINKKEVLIKPTKNEN